MFYVVRASRELMEEVQAIINGNFHLYKDIVDPVDLPEHHVDAAWADRNFPIREFYLARDGARGEYVGAASYQNMGKFAYIGYFYIKREFQRQTYGRSLMQFMEMRATLDTLRDIRLFCNSKSTWALNFYSAMGFQVLTGDKAEILAIDQGIMTPFYEQGALFLKKTLESRKKQEKGPK